MKIFSTENTILNKAFTIKKSTCAQRVKITEKLKISFGQFTCSKLKNDLNCGSTNVFPIIITHIQVALFHVKELASYGSKSCF